MQISYDDDNNNINSNKSESEKEKNNNGSMNLSIDDNESSGDMNNQDLAMNWLDAVYGSFRIGQHR